MITVNVYNWCLRSFSLDAELNDNMLRPALYLLAIIAVCSATVHTPSGMFV